MILRLQELEFLFNAVQRLRNSEFEGLACSLVRRLGGDQRGGPWDGDAGGRIKQRTERWVEHKQNIKLEVAENGVPNSSLRFTLGRGKVDTTSTPGF